MATQLIKPTPQIACQPGLCLEYVRETFGIAAKYPSAIAGWQASKYQHLGHDFPNDVAVPLWFSLSDNELGHVALRQPDGTIWSSSHPTQRTPVQHASLHELETYYNGRLQYLGWTEDVEDVRVVDGIGADPGNGPAPIAYNSNGVPIAPTQSVHEYVIERLQKGIPVPGFQGDTGHRPGHPAIEHMRINQQLDAENAKKLKNKR